MKPSKNNVLIAGGGPAGLTLAAALVKRNIPVMVIESSNELSSQWRASTFHPPTLELLQELGIVEEMLERGLIAKTYQIHDRREGLIAEFDMTELEDETPYPFRLQLEQYKYSEMLLRELKYNPLFRIFWAETVLSVTDEGDGVVIQTRTEDGSTHEHHALYAVGADGAKSVVRKGLGLDFSGMTYPVRFLILSVDYPFENHFTNLSYVNYMWDPEEPLMLLRIPDTWRVMFSVAEGEQEADVLDEARIQDRLRYVIGAGPEKSFSISSVQYYSVHQRVAQTFRRGRVMLIGDAAHINSPVGGLGLNSGIHDAFDLAMRLDQHLRGGETDWVLDEFSNARRRVALDVVQQVTHRNTEQMTEGAANARESNRFRLEAISKDEAQTKAWLRESSMITAVREIGVGTSAAEQASDRKGASAPL